MRDPLHFGFYIVGPGVLIAFFVWMSVLSGDPIVIAGAGAMFALYGLAASVARRTDVFDATYSACRLTWRTPHASGSWTVDTMTFTPPRFPGALPRITSDGADRYLRLRPGNGLPALLDRIDDDIRRHAHDPPTPNDPRRIP